MELFWNLCKIIGICNEICIHPFRVKKELIIFFCGILRNLPFFIVLWRGIQACKGINPFMNRRTNNNKKRSPNTLKTNLTMFKWHAYIGLFVCLLSCTFTQCDWSGTSILFKHYLVPMRCFHYNVLNTS